MYIPNDPLYPQSPIFKYSNICKLYETIFECYSNIDRDTIPVRFLLLRPPAPNEYAATPQPNIRRAVHIGKFSPGEGGNDSNSNRRYFHRIFAKHRNHQQM